MRYLILAAVAAACACGPASQASGTPEYTYQIVHTYPHDPAAFTQGLAADADDYRCPLLGGDTDSTPGPITISISAIGTLPTGTMVRRSGAKAGDRRPWR